MTLVFDAGSYEIKAGLHTDEFPSIRYKPYCMNNGGTYSYSEFLDSQQSKNEYEPFISNGELNRAVFETITEDIVKRVSSKSLIWVKTDDQSRVMGNKCFELFYEQYGIENLYSASSPVLVTFVIWAHV